MKRSNLRSFVSATQSLDLFGHEPKLLYRGQTAYTTVPGALCSLALYTLMLIHLIQLLVRFADGSGQQETYQELQIDLFDFERQLLAENGVQISFVSREPIPASWSLKAIQILPCESNEKPCDHEERALEVPFAPCTSPEQLENVREYSSKLSGRQITRNRLQNALCINSEKLFVQGRFFSYKEASLTIKLQKNDQSSLQNMSQPADTRTEAVVDLDISSILAIEPLVLITFNQVDMDSGEMKKITKDFYLPNNEKVFLNPNEFVNRNDYVGLITFDPDPVTFLTIGDVERDAK